MTPSSDLDAFFSRNGFIHIPGALNPEEVAATRDYLFDAFEKAQKSRSDPSKVLLASELWHTPEINGFPFRKKIVDSLKAILGDDYFLFSDITSIKNQYGLSGGKKNPGWHWDSSSEGKQTYLCDPEYRFVTCGIYLQDNTEDYGGGVDYIPGRHRWPFRTPNTNLNFKIKNLFDLIAVKTRPVMAPLKAGDFLAFHSCLPHRSTLPKKLLPHITPENIKSNSIDPGSRELTKFTIYFNACRRNSVDGYLNNLIRRANEEELDNSAARNFVYTNAARMVFPRDYPGDVVDAIKGLGLDMASVDSSCSDDLTNRYESRLQSLEK